MAIQRRLYEVAADVLALEELLLESGGEWTPEVEELMKEVQGNLEAKVDGYASLIKEWGADAKKWKAEEARCAGHRRARENAATRLKERLLEAMVDLKVEKVVTPRFKVALQKGAPTAECLVGPAELPDEFVRVSPEERYVNQRALLAALKSEDDEVRGAAEKVAFLHPSSPHLRIR